MTPGCRPNDGRLGTGRAIGLSGLVQVLLRRFRWVVVAGARIVRPLDIVERVRVGRHLVRLAGVWFTRDAIQVGHLDLLLPSLPMLAPSAGRLRGARFLTTCSRDGSSGRGES